MLKDAENTRDLQRLSARLVNAQEDERRTIARELHDEVGQALDRHQGGAGGGRAARRR